MRSITKRKRNWPWLFHSLTTASLDKFKLKILILTCLCPFPFDKADHMRARLHVNACENGMYTFHSLCSSAYLKNLSKSCWWAKKLFLVTIFHSSYHASPLQRPVEPSLFVEIWLYGVHSIAKQQHFETGWLGCPPLYAMLVIIDEQRSFPLKPENKFTVYTSISNPFILAKK